MATINRTNIAMLSREIRSNDWRINGLERKLDALNAKLNDLLEEGVDGGNDGDNTGGDNTGNGGSGGKLTFKLNENIKFYCSALYDDDPRHRVVYTTTQTFNITPTAIDSIDGVYLIYNGTDFTTILGQLDDVTGGDWRFLSSDYTIRVGDTLYTTDRSGSYYPPYTFATMETDNGTPRTIFTAYSQGGMYLNNANRRWVRTIGTPAAIRSRFIPMNGIPITGDTDDNRFEVTTDFFGTAATEEYANKGILTWNASNNIYELTNDMQLLDSVTSDMYMMIMVNHTYADAVEVSYH